MGKIRNPISFAKYFRIDARELQRMRILNPVLNVDTKLFIDPVLLDVSSNKEISKGASRSFHRYFEDVIKLLQASSQRGDIAWRTARGRLRFREVKETCLGYGGSTIHGSAFGSKLSARLIETAKQIVDLGVTDPDLFKLLPLLEEGVGPDLISDLTTNVIVKDLARLTQSVTKKLGIRGCNFNIAGEIFNLPENPTEPRPTPILLIPTDILRSLPLASDWSEIADAAAQSAATRQRINRLIGNIWEAKTRRDKARLREASLASRDAFQALLDLIHEVQIRPYDLRKDPEGLIVWRAVHETVARDFPLQLRLVGLPDPNKAMAIVSAIIEQFRNLIETKGLWKVLWCDGKPHDEKVAQMVFFAVADGYCKANNLDVTPEAETGVGPVDFKFSSGYRIRVLVEIKLSTNPKLVAGYEKQLNAYKSAEHPIHATYLVIDVGGMGRKDQKLVETKNSWASKGGPVSDLVFVDGTPKPSASKR